MMTPETIRVRSGEGGRLLVQIPYSPDYVAKIKTVAGRRWHAHERHWSVPQGEGTLGQLLNLFPGTPVEVDPTLEVVNTRDKGKTSSALLVRVLADLRTGLWSLGLPVSALSSRPTSCRDGRSGHQSVFDASGCDKEG